MGNTSGINTHRDLCRPGTPQVGPWIYSLYDTLEDLISKIHAIMSDARLKMTRKLSNQTDLFANKDAQTSHKSRASQYLVQIKIRLLPSNFGQIKCKY